MAVLAYAHHLCNDRRAGLLNIKFGVLQMLLLGMFCSSMSFTKDILDAASVAGFYRYILLFLFPVMPWAVLSSTLVQHRRRIKHDLASVR